MRSHRLDRLARLTQGVALVGFGVTSLACSKDHPPTINAPPDQQPHINATVTPTASTAPPDASTVTPTASTPPTSSTAPPDGPHVNATATPPPSGSAPKLVPPPHVNAPPKKP